MMMFGYYNRIGAIFITFTLIVAVLLVHTGHFASLTPQGGWGLELQAFYLLGAFSVVFLGSGKYAIKAD
jgi:putative oxidoreductase